MRFMRQAERHNQRLAAGLRAVLVIASAHWQLYSSLIWATPTKLRRLQNVPLGLDPDSLFSRPEYLCGRIDPHLATRCDLVFPGRSPPPPMQFFRPPPGQLTRQVSHRPLIRKPFRRRSG